MQCHSFVLFLFPTFTMLKVLLGFPPTSPLVRLQHSVSLSYQKKVFFMYRKYCSRRLSVAFNIYSAFITTFF